VRPFCYLLRYSLNKIKKESGGEVSPNAHIS
jgi:hypothetical protein